MDTSVEGFPPPSSGSHWRTSSDLQQARLNEYGEHLLEEEEVQDEHEKEEEEGEEAASLDYCRRERDEEEEEEEEEEERHNGEDDGDATADYHGSSGDRSHEYDDDKGDSREENSSGSDSRSSSSSGASNDDEERNADQNKEYSLPPLQNRQQYRRHRPACHSLDLSSDGTLDGERVDGDEAEHNYNRSGHHQQRQYHTHSGVRSTQEAASAPGPGWDNHLHDNVEDSFSLIQNFYDVGFT